MKIEKSRRIIFLGILPRGANLLGGESPGGGGGESPVTGGESNVRGGANILGGGESPVTPPHRCVWTLFQRLIDINIVTGLARCAEVRVENLYSVALI